MKQHIITALGLIGLGLALGVFVNKAAETIANRDRQVTVRGLSECEVQANKVTWPVVYKLAGNDLPQLYQQVENNNRIVINYLISNGINQNEFTVNAPDITDRQADSYSNNVVRFALTQVITVTSEQVDKVRDLINRQGELLKKGIAVTASDWNYRTIYEYTLLNDIKPEMIADATSKARQAADKFAEDSGSKVGEIKSATQGQFSIEDRDPYTPNIKKVRVVTTLTYAIE